MKPICINCKKNETCTGEICLSGEWFQPKYEQFVSFPKLNNLTPTLESCTMKVLEETGEIMQLLGKGQRKSGESKNSVLVIDDTEYGVLLACEAMDLAQSAVTMMYEVCRHFGIIEENVVKAHEEKLLAKGYMVGS